MGLRGELAEAVTIIEHVLGSHEFCERPARCPCCKRSHHRTCTDLQEEGIEVNTGPFPFPCEGCKLYEDAQAWYTRNIGEAG